MNRMEQIAYLNRRLLEEMPELPAEERAKYVHISLEKARRLEKMISEFFEITRYNTQQIAIDPKPVDLYYLLVQVIDEHIPLFTEHGNYVTLRAQEPLQVWGDGEKLARVFNNLLKNAAAYSDPGTEVTVSAEAGKEAVSVRVTSIGKTIPSDKLDALFENIVTDSEKKEESAAEADEPKPKKRKTAVRKKPAAAVKEESQKAAEETKPVKKTRRKKKAEVKNSPVNPKQSIR